MQTTWKPTVAGVLAIAAGASNILVALVMSLFMPVAAPFYTAFMAVGILLVLFLATGIVAIIGGTQSLKRRRWGLSLAGAICAMMPPATLLGIISTVFVTMARDEFEGGPVATTSAPHVVDAEVVSAPEGPGCQPCGKAMLRPGEGEKNA